MRRLASWSSYQVLRVWLAWCGLVVVLLAFNFIRYLQMSGRAERPQSSAESLVLDTSGSAPNSAIHQRLKYLPEQHTDFVYSVVIDRMLLLKFSILLIGPPALLTAAWLYARRSGGQR